MINFQALAKMPEAEISKMTKAELVAAILRDRHMFDYYKKKAEELQEQIAQNSGLKMAIIHLIMRANRRRTRTEDCQTYQPIIGKRITGRARLFGTTDRHRLDAGKGGE
jgi:hypothetical protein